MPTKQLATNKIRAICELRREGLSQSQISEKLGVSRSTVSKIVNKVYSTYKQYISNGEHISDGVLVERVYLPSVATPVDLEKVHYLASSGLPLSFIHAESDWAGIPSMGIGYSQLCERYKSWTASLSKEDARNCRPGELCLIRNCGLSIPLSLENGKTMAKCDIFVAMLPASGFCYFDVFNLHSAHDLVSALQDMHTNFGAVALNIDGTLKGIKKPEMRVFDEHYGSKSILRTRELKKLRPGEHIILKVIKWLQQQLKAHMLLNISDVKALLQQLATSWNQQRLPELHHEVIANGFLELDRQHMLDLPSTDFVYSIEKSVTVHVDNHVSYQGAYYSVPYQLIGATLRLSATKQQVRIYADEELVAKHRIVVKHQYSTDEEHMFSGREWDDPREYTPERLLRWARKYGSAVFDWAGLRMDEVQFPEQAFRWTMRELAKGDSNSSLNRRCQIALSSGRRSLGH